MAKLNTVFDSGKHENMQSGFDPIPAGTYLSMLVESAVLTTKKKDGEYAKLKFQILQGKYKGRFIWTNLNLINPNPIAVEIAQKELATLCRACGKAVIQDTQELHGIPIQMKVKIVPAKGDFPASNSPIGYEPANAHPSTLPAGKAPADPIESESTSDETEVPWE